MRIVATLGSSSIELDTAGSRPVGAAKLPNLKSSKRTQQLYLLQKALAAHGWTSPVIHYSMAQCLFESNDFQSRISKNYNFAGIKISPWSKAEGAFDQGSGYAGYPNLDGFCVDYKRILQLKPGVPWNATTADEFVTKIKANKYFEAPTSDYARGINSKLPIVNQYFKDLANPDSDLNRDVKTATKVIQDSHEQMITQKPDPSLNNFWSDLPTWGKVGIGFAGFLLLVNAMKK